MARGDLLLNLVKAGVTGDTGTFRRTVDAIVADERGKQHNILADQIERVARTPNGNGLPAVPKPSPESGHRGRDFISEIIPRRKLKLSCQAFRDSLRKGGLAVPRWPYEQKAVSRLERMRAQ
jgi:hypothetical protein